MQNIRDLIGSSSTIGTVVALFFKVEGREDRLAVAKSVVQSVAPPVCRCVLGKTLYESICLIEKRCMNVYVNEFVKCFDCLLR